MRVAVGATFYVLN